MISWWKHVIVCCTHTSLKHHGVLIISSDVPKYLTKNTVDSDFFQSDLQFGDMEIPTKNLFEDLLVKVHSRSAAKSAFHAVRSSFNDMFQPCWQVKACYFAPSTIWLGKTPYLPGQFNSFSAFCTHPTRPSLDVLVSPGVHLWLLPSEETLWQWKVFSKPSKLNLDFGSIMSSTNKKGPYQLYVGF